MATQVQFSEIGQAEVLQLVDVDLPEPGPGQVRITIQAIGINRADAMLRQDQYIESPTMPSKLGYDAAGEVVAVGADVSGVAVGDRVLTIPSFSQSEHGVYGDEAIVPADACWPWPEELSAEAAACVGVQYTTVYFALKTIGQLAGGDAVLLTAATGGVGFAAIEVARQLGATVLATTRKRDKADELLDAGADHVIVTDEEDLSERVAELTDAGVKLAFDPIGGAMVPAILDSLAPGGRCLLYGILDPTEPTLPLMPILAKGLTIQGYTVFQFTGYPNIGLPQQTGAVAEARDWLLPRLADGRLKPRISQTFPLDRVQDAHRELESNNQTGKIVLTVG